MSPETSGRLARLQIELLAETKAHFLFARDNLIALVERTETGFGSIGSTGVMTERGLNYLVSREGRHWLVGKTAQTAAEPAQVEAIRTFSEDLKTAIG